MPISEVNDEPRDRRTDDGEVVKVRKLKKFNRIGYCAGELTIVYLELIASLSMAFKYEGS